jgi:hypothetical protein
MLSHIAKDLYESYLTEMEPQLGKKEDGGGEAKGGAPALGDQSAKRIRQAVYDIRYRARREDIGIDQAYSQYMSHTSMPANEKAAVREKLGLGASGGPVKEEAEAGKHYLRVDPRSRKTGEKPYVKKFDPSSEKDRKKRHGLQQKGIVTTVTKHGSPYDGAGEKYEKKYGPATGKNTVGDKDKDGTVEPDGHEYAGVKDNAVKKAISKKATKKESFYSWREEIREVVEKINSIKEKEKQIKEKPVNNKVIVNPEIKTEEIAHVLGGEIVESVDLGENYIEEVADFATEYFYSEGLNENGINILIEDMGVDEFVDYIFDLDEARRSGRIEPVTKSGKDVGSLKGGAKSAAITRLRKEKAARKEAEASSSKPSGMTAALKSQSEKAKVSSDLKKAKTEKKVEKAKASQTPASEKSSEGTKKEVKKGILGAIKDRASRDTELLKKSWKTARDAGKSAERKVASAAGTAAGAVHGAAKAVHRAGQEFGKSEAGQKLKKGVAKTAVAAAGAAGAGLGAKVAGKTNAQAAGRAAGTFIRKMREDYELWINELISEGYDVTEYSEEYLIDTYLPENLDEGIGSALRGLLTPKPSERQQLAKQRMDAHRAAMASGKQGDSPYTPQRKKPSTPIKKPNTPERDPWSGNPETDKAWAKGGTAASSPRAYKREDFEEWMEALLEEINLDENTIFLVFESNFMAEEMFLVEEDPCWKGYTQVGMKKKGGREVPNCVPAKGVEKAKGYKKEEIDLEEKAPPGAKFERMVKHIKKGYAKKGGLSKKEKSIAYATAWAQKNKTRKEEVENTEDKKKL